MQLNRYYMRDSETGQLWQFDEDAIKRGYPF